MRRHLEMSGTAILMAILLAALSIGLGAPRRRAPAQPAVQMVSSRVKPPPPPKGGGKGGKRSVAPLWIQL